jgi:hypothetical protein
MEDTHLLDQHVEVLGNLRCEACEDLSVSLVDQAEACVYLCSAQ